MSCDLETAAPDGPAFRVARAPDPWAWPDGSQANPDGTFGNRWDDPEGTYRVLYASSSRFGTFLETLARFRPDLAVVAELGEILGAVSGAKQGNPSRWTSNSSECLRRENWGQWRRSLTTNYRALRFHTNYALQTR